MQSGFSICSRTATSAVASHKGAVRGELAIAIIGAGGSVADRGGWAGVQQATQGGRGAELAAQQEPLALP